MTREEAIDIIKNLPIYRAEMEYDRKSDLMQALEKAIESLSMKPTDKYNRMLEAFECDFSLIEDGQKHFSQLDEIFKGGEEVNGFSLRKDMELFQELVFKIRYGKAEILVKEMTRTELIKQAIESAKCRIYKLNFDTNKELSAHHQRKAENQKELMEITVEALEKLLLTERE